MSRVTVSLGSARNSSQLHRFGWSTSPVIERLHWESAVRGVGPADRTGKSLTRYWPGGSRAPSSSSRRRPLNPRVTNDMDSPPFRRRRPLRWVMVNACARGEVTEAHGALPPPELVPRSSDALARGKVNMEGLPGSIQLHHVTAGYGKDPVFSRFSLSVKPGEFVYVLGPSGSGKSTLFKILY